MQGFRCESLHAALLRLTLSIKGQVMLGMDKLAHDARAQIVGMMRSHSLDPSRDAGHGGRDQQQALETGRYYRYDIGIESDSGQVDKLTSSL
jgi:hypothetical protein